MIFQPFLQPAFNSLFKRAANKLAARFVFPFSNSNKLICGHSSQTLHSRPEQSGRIAKLIEMANLIRLMPLGLIVLSDILTGQYSAGLRFFVNK